MPFVNFVTRMDNLLNDL